MSVRAIVSGSSERMSVRWEGSNPVSDYLQGLIDRESLLYLFLAAGNAKDREK